MTATKKAPVQRDGVEVESMGARAVVRPDALDDYDVMRKLCDVGENSARGLFVIMEAVFGDDLKRVTDELRDDDGHHQRSVEHRLVSVPPSGEA